MVYVEDAWIYAFLGPYMGKRDFEGFLESFLILDGILGFIRGTDSLSPEGFV